MPLSTTISPVNLRERLNGLGLFCAVLIMLFPTVISASVGLGRGWLTYSLGFQPQLQADLLFSVSCSD